MTLNEIWELGELIRYRWWLLPFEVTVMLWSNCWSQLQIKWSTILAVKWIFCFQNSSTEHYQYTSKAAVIKLSFWICFLMCCRLQELEVISCEGMTDTALLDGIESLHELTSLDISLGYSLTTEGLSRFLNQPSMTSVELLNVIHFYNMDDDGLKGIAKRCNKLTYLHV
jgi:hypothetical protein